METDSLRIALPSGITIILQVNDRQVSPLHMLDACGRHAGPVETMRAWLGLGNSLRIEDSRAVRHLNQLSPEDQCAIDRELVARNLTRAPCTEAIRTIANAPEPNNIHAAFTAHSWMEGNPYRTQLARTAPNLIPLALCSQHITDIVDSGKPLFDSLAAITTLPKAQLQRVATYPWTGAIILDPIVAANAAHESGMPTDWWPMKANEEERLAFETMMACAIVARLQQGKPLARTLLTRNAPNWQAHRDRIAKHIDANDPNSPESLIDAVNTTINRSNDAARLLCRIATMPTVFARLQTNPQQVFEATGGSYATAATYIQTIKENANEAIANAILSLPPKDLAQLNTRLEYAAATSFDQAENALIESSEIQNNQYHATRRIEWLPFGDRAANTDDPNHNVWIPPFPPQIVDRDGQTWALIPLWCRTQLEDEGRGYAETGTVNPDDSHGLQICVGTSPTYAIACRSKRSVIISIRRRANESEIRENPGNQWIREACLELDTNDWRILQLRGHKNSTPNADVTDIVKNLAQGIRSGEIPITEEYRNWTVIARGDVFTNELVTQNELMANPVAAKQALDAIAHDIIGYAPPNWQETADQFRNLLNSTARPPKAILGAAAAAPQKAANAVIRNAMANSPLLASRLEAVANGITQAIDPERAPIPIERPRNQPAEETQATERQAPQHPIQGRLAKTRAWW